jgi:hypothetical protein
VGPKSDKIDDEGVRFHARERMKQDGNSEWEFEEAPTTMLPAQGWNCVGWIKKALSELQTSTDVIGTSVVEWEAVRNAARSYCQKKKDQHRFDGKGSFDTSRVPTFDLIQGTETIE